MAIVSIDATSKRFTASGHPLARISPALLASENNVSKTIRQRGTAWSGMARFAADGRISPERQLRRNVRAANNPLYIALGVAAGKRESVICDEIIMQLAEKHGVANVSTSDVIKAMESKLASLNKRAAKRAAAAEAPAPALPEAPESGSAPDGETESS